MRKAGSMGYVTVLFLTMVIPLMGALFWGVKYFYPLQYKKFMIFMVMMVFLSGSILRFICKDGGIKVNKRNIYVMLPLVLFLISLVLKIFVAYAEGCDVFQNSEYGCVLRVASGMASKEDLRHISVFPHWSLAGFLDGFFVKAFSSIPAYLVCEYVNAFLLSISVVFVYYSSYYCFKNVEAAFWGGLLFAIAPTENLYFLMISNEFWAICFINIFVFLAIKTDILLSTDDFSSVGGGWNLTVFVLIGIVSLWIIKFSKPIGAVFFIAIIICWMYCLFNRNWTLKDKKFYKACVLLLCIMIGSTLLSIGYRVILSRRTGFPVNENAMPHFLFIGLDPNYNEVGNVYEAQMIETDFDYDTVNSEYMKTIQKDIASNLAFIPYKLKENFRLLWEDYGNGIRMTLHRFYETGTGNSFFNLLLTRIWLVTLTQLYYLIVIAFALISVVGRLILYFIGGMEKDKNVKYLFIILCVFGVALGLVIGEAQERYKCVIMPLIYLLAGDGIGQFWSCFDKFAFLILDKRFAGIYKIRKGDIK